jgi:hypothetical protein
MPILDAKSRVARLDISEIKTQSSKWQIKIQKVRTNIGVSASRRMGRFSAHEDN